MVAFMSQRPRRLHTICLSNDEDDRYRVIINRFTQLSEGNAQMCHILGQCMVIANPLANPDGSVIGCLPLVYPKLSFYALAGFKKKEKKENFGKQSRSTSRDQAGIYPITPIFSIHFPAMLQSLQ